MQPSRSTSPTSALMSPPLPAAPPKEYPVQHRVMGGGRLPMRRGTKGIPSLASPTNNGNGKGKGKDEKKKDPRLGHMSESEAELKVMKLLHTSDYMKQEKEKRDKPKVNG